MPRLAHGLLEDGLLAVPYHAATLNNGQIWCGGAIISSEYILTAAHCFWPNKATEKDIQVVAGTIDVLSGQSKGGQVRDVQKIIRHSGYHPTRYGNDITILKLKTPLVFNVNVQSIPMTTHNPASKSVAIISGTGSISRILGSVQFLRYVAIPINSREVCESEWPGFDDTMICGGEKDGQHNACQGDSGGPLVVNKVLVGFTSFGPECGNAFSTVYTIVAYFRNWIRQQTGV